MLLLLQEETEEDSAASQVTGASRALQERHLHLRLLPCLTGRGFSLGGRRRHRRKREEKKKKSDILNQKEKKTFQNKPLWGGSAEWSPSFTPSLKLLLGPGLWLAQVLVALGGGLAG